ncbi:hypothetical protein L2E82_37303 [Cichorium intybus]|uniref:Uncharacterized protein n=1 Tax=Cichorium intybus TaxID=13427 RepID=A0ACB9AD89_CICIN|nr:hypothetical protein L2E82_37303 [Cichorium intybus]
MIQILDSKARQEHDTRGSGVPQSKPTTVKMSAGKEKEQGDPQRYKSGSRDSGKEHQPEGERPPEIQSNMQAMIAAEVAKAIKDILPTYLKPQVEATTRARVPEKTRRCTYDVFQKCKPYDFYGKDDPIVAKNWLTRVEKMFRTSKCDEADKVEFATNLLKEDAQFWWENTCMEIGESLAYTLSWEQFKLKFTEYYCSNNAMKGIEEEFLKLQQGSRTEEERRTEREVGGSRRKWEGKAVDTSQRSATTGSQFRGETKKKEERWCKKCRRKHTGECDSRTPPSVCFQCGKTGHMARQCTESRPVCFNCGESVHIRPDFPKMKSESQRDSQKTGRGGGRD